MHRAYSTRSIPFVNDWLKPVATISIVPMALVCISYFEFIKN